MAERKVKEVTNSMESLNAELRREKQLNSSAMNMAKSVSKENMAIKRAIQSMGCKVHVSGSGECTVDIESNPDIVCCSSRKESNSNVRDEKTEAPVSVLVTTEEDDDGNNGIVRVCETLCPFGSAAGGCRWPKGGCAQLGSQYVGLKANFDAFDQLSIDDTYFKSE